RPLAQGDTSATAVPSTQSVATYPTKLPHRQPLSSDAAPTAALCPRSRRPHPVERTRWLAAHPAGPRLCALLHASWRAVFSPDALPLSHHAPARTSAPRPPGQGSSRCALRAWECAATNDNG